MILRRFDVIRFFILVLLSNASYRRHVLTVRINTKICEEFFATSSQVTITSDVTGQTPKQVKFWLGVVRVRFRDRFNPNLELTPSLTLQQALTSSQKSITTANRPRIMKHVKFETTFYFYYLK